MAAAFTDPFCRVEELEILRREIVALNALDPPESSRNEYDTVVDESNRITESVERHVTAIQQAGSTATEQQRALRESSIEAHRTVCRDQREALLYELDNYTAWAAHRASTLAHEAQAVIKRRYALAAIWAGPAVLAAAWMVASLADTSDSRVPDATVPVIGCAAWGGLAALFYYLAQHRSRKHAIAAAAQINPDPRNTSPMVRRALDRPGVAFACSILALAALPMVTFGACIVIPVGAVGIGLYLSTD